jgi:hypothetical protein
MLPALVGLTFVFGLFPLWDYDIWGHLAAARWILDHGSIPSVDPFVWGSPGREWINLYWLFQLLAHGCYALAGADGLVLLKASLAAFAVYLGLRASQPAEPALVVLVWLIPLISLSGRIYERPELISLVMVAAFVLLSLGNRGRWWWLPLLQVVWVNTHPFFSFGPVLVALSLLDQTNRTRERALTLVGTLLACVVNPYGLRGALFPLGVIFGQAADHAYYKQFIGELRPVSFFLARDPSNPYLLAFLLTFALGAASTLLVIGARKVRWFEVATWGLFAALGWSATRNVAFAALVTAIVATRQLARWIESKATRKRPAVRIPTSTAIIAIGIVVVLLSSGGLYQWAGEGREIGLGERPKWYAHAAHRALLQPGMPQRAFVAHLGEAYLSLFETRGQVQVFASPHLEVTSRQAFDDYLQIVRAMSAGDTPAWESRLYRDRIWPAIVLDRARSGAAIEGVMNAPNWQVVYQDDLAVVFMRRSSIR